MVKKQKPWTDEKVRIKAIREAVKKSGKSPKEFGTRDFRKYGLSGAFRYYNNSPSIALKAAGLLKDESERSGKYGLRKKWKSDDEIRKAIVDMVEKSGKKPNEITKKDFFDAKLSGPFKNKYGESPIKALKDAGFSVTKYEMKNPPKDKWRFKEDRINAIKRMVKESGKQPGAITERDFKNSKLFGLLMGRYRGSPFNALEEAGLIKNEMDMKSKPHGYWKIKENRIRETGKLVEELDKPISEITQLDFVSTGRTGLLARKNNSVYKTLIEAGFDIKPEERKMVPLRHWQSRDRCILAIRNMVTTTGKRPQNITQNDFKKNNLGGLLAAIYHHSPYAALKNAGLVNYNWEMRYKPKGIWRIKSNRIDATRWLVEKVNKEPKEVTYNDFRKYGLITLLKYTGSVMNCLNEADFTFKAWERGRVPRFHWENKKNRVEAINELIEVTGKEPIDITISDFFKFGLGALISHHYEGSSYRAMIDAGYDIDKQEHDRKRILGGGYKVKSNHGDKFRSYDEADIDNYFWNHGVKDHHHNVKYPQSDMNCDFVFCEGKIWLEYAGLIDSPQNISNKYKEKIRMKEEIAKRHNINLIRP